MEAIDLIRSGRAKLTPQDEKFATYAPKLKKEDGLIDWSEPVLKIHNKVRGFLPWPGAYTYYEGRILKILRTEVSQVEDKEADSGRFLGAVKDRGMMVKARDRVLLIRDIQIEGKKPMDACAFLRGHRVCAGYLFGRR